MKRIINLTFVLLLTLIITPTAVIAHPGRTDSGGGHTCRTNCPSWGYSYGEYHYHGGYTPPEPTPIITYEYEYESKKIPFKTSKVEDDALLKGETRTKQVGIPGTKRIKYKVTYADFVEKSRKKYSEEVITAPTNEIIAIGTKIPEPAPATDDEGNVAGTTRQQGENAYAIGGLVGFAIISAAIILFVRKKPKKT